MLISCPQYNNHSVKIKKIMECRCQRVGKMNDFMKKILLFCGLIFSVFMTSYAQETDNAKELKKGDPLKDYLRPSMTTLFLDRGEPLSERLIAQMTANGIPGKFNDNSIEMNTLRVDGDIIEEELRQLIETQATKYIMKRWFPSHDSTGWAMNVVHERGMYNATDADVIAANASFLKDALLKDQGLDLINRSYVVVYDFYDIKRIRQDGTEGYQTNCNVHLYHIDWNDEVKNIFFDQWLNPNAIDEVTFPVKHVASFIKQNNLSPVKITQADQGDFLRLSDEKLFHAFSKEIEKAVDVYMTKINEDFKVKAAIFATSPIRAKIGTKEGVTVDQRYYVYERALNETGEEVAIKKGVIRATSNIVKNDSIATGDGGATTFYQTYGLAIREGMTIQQKADWGVGVSLLVGTDVTVLGEFSVGMWLGKYIPSLQTMKVPYGSKIYLKLSVPVTTMKIDGIKLENDSGDGLRCPLFGFGISKDFYFARVFSATPYLGMSALIVSSKSESTVNYYNYSTSGFDIGVNGSMAILDYLQITGSIGYSGLKSSWYSMPITFGVGARYQF